MVPFYTTHKLKLSIKITPFILTLDNGQSNAPTGGRLYIDEKIENNLTQ